MDEFPLGVEFDPTNEEVIRYLQWKLDGTPVFQGTVCDIDAYSQHPKDLPGQFKLFFTPRHRASGNNVRRSISFRGKHIGYWHTGDKIKIYRDNDEPEEKPVLVGQMTPFSFKVGTSGTDWLMQEFLLPEVRGQFQERAICKVYNKRDGIINANKGKGKMSEDISEFDSWTCPSKRRKINEEFEFMSEENQVYLTNMPNTSNVCNFSSGYAPETSTSELGNSLIAPGQHRTSCNQVMLPSPSDELHEKSSLMTPPLQMAAGPFYEEFQSLTGENQLYCSSMPSSSNVRNLTSATRETDAASQVYNFADDTPVEESGPGNNGRLASPLRIGEKVKGFLSVEEAVLQQETAHREFYQRMLEEGCEFENDNLLALNDTDGDLCYVGNDAHNAKNDEVNGHDDTQNDGGMMIQDDLVEVTAEDEEPSAVLSFPPELQQIVHHSAAEENLSPQPLASSNDGSELYTDDPLSAYDLSFLDPGLQFSIDDLTIFSPGLQFSTDDLPNFDPGTQYYNDIPELSNLVAEDYSIWF